MMDDDGKILTDIRKWNILDKLPQYEDVGEFLKFVHNYVLPIYGEKYEEVVKE